MALDAILAHKRAEVAARKAGASLESLLARARPSDRDFAGALRRGHPGFILEIYLSQPDPPARAPVELRIHVVDEHRHSTPADAILVGHDVRRRRFGAHR